MKLDFQIIFYLDGQAGSCLIRPFQVELNTPKKNIFIKKATSQTHLALMS